MVWCSRPDCLRNLLGLCRYDLFEGWARDPRRKRWWIVVGLSVVAVLCVWLTAPFLPDPITMVFKRPTTQLSSNSPANQWAM